MGVRNFRATNNLISVSAYQKETAINTEQTLDLTLACALSDIINQDRQREKNDDEATGFEEPTLLYDLGSLASGTLNFPRAQPQHFAFVNAFGMGSVSSAAAGSGYEHTITPIKGDLDSNRSIPSFTLAQRYGDEVNRKRFASMFVDSITETYEKGKWCVLASAIKGTGKVTNSVCEETVSAAGNVTSLTLAANAVQGVTADIRLQNVQRIRVNISGSIWTEVAYSAVSGATPAIITITSAGAGTGPFNYKILYVPSEVAAWQTAPAKVNETPLRVSQMTLNVGGTWTGSAFSGGRAMQSEMQKLTCTLNNNMDISFVPGGGGTYAGRAFRNGRLQTIKLEREFREYIFQKHMDDNDTMGLYILAQGNLYDGANYYQVEKIYPSVGVLQAPISVNGKVLAEAGDLQVLEDPTYGSVITKVKNLAATYAA